MRPPRSGGRATQAQELDESRLDAPISSVKLESLQVPFLRRRLADAIEHGDDRTAEHLRQALDRALNGQDAAAPLPPSYPSWRFEPMTWGEVERWIESYNAWVEIWNRHETSRDLPLSPEWPDAQLIWIAGRWPRSALAFRTRRDHRLGVIRFKRRCEFHGGWSFCRNPASVERVVWAGWAP